MFSICFYLASGHMIHSSADSISDAKTAASELGARLFHACNRKTWTFTNHYKKEGAWLWRTPRSDWQPETTEGAPATC